MAGDGCPTTTMAAPDGGTYTIVGAGTAGRPEGTRPDVEIRFVGGFAGAADVPGPEPAEDVDDGR